MNARIVGRRILRVNDETMLRGEPHFIADLVAASERKVLHAAVVRSPAAHGVLEGVDAAALPPGAHLIGPSEIRRRALNHFPLLWHLSDQRQVSTPLLDEKVRCVGQPVAVVAAPTPAAAADAAEQVSVRIREVPAVIDLRQAASPSAPKLWEDLDDNVLAAFEVGDSAEHTEAVFASADRRLGATLRIGRLSPTPMEGRGVLAIPERSGKLVVHTSSQAPHAVRDSICEVLGMPQHKVRVIACDVGGGFGVKDHIYEDELMVVIAALALDTPVAWVESRTETMLGAAHARDEIHEIEVAFDDDGALRGLRTESLRNAGAQCFPFGGGPLFVALGMSPGPYTWDAVRGSGRLIATNTTATGAYRGFGQPQAVMINERAVELAAQALGRHPAELREQNMIRPSQQPYETRTHITYDNGDYAEPLRLAREHIEARRTPAPDDGKLRGVGYCSYVQLAGVGPSFLNQILGLRIGGYESATVRMEPDGSVRLYTGVSPHGQGLETSLAQLVAEELGVSVSDVEVIHSDTDFTPYSAYGTAASRSMAVGGGAAMNAARELAEKLKAVAAEMLEANPADLILADGVLSVTGTASSVPVSEVAAAAHRGFPLPEGQPPGLTASNVYDPPSPTFSYASHACAAAVDPETGGVEIEDYVVVQDCGVMVNPMIVEGQVQGAATQGIGAALLEEFVYDPGGQPLSTNLADYLAPGADSLPFFLVEHTVHPSPYTPGGMKGMGEGGTSGAYSCTVNAVFAALGERADGESIATPLSPKRLWEILTSS